MAKQFPNTVHGSGIPGGELYKIYDDGVAALYCTSQPLAASGGKHPIAGNMNAQLTGAEVTDCTTLLTALGL
jgi:hypothetical protein